MEYVTQRGVFDDLPLAEMKADLVRLRPARGGRLAAMRGGDLLADVAGETVAAASLHR